MDTRVAELIKLLAIAQAAAVIVMVPLSVFASAWALDGLEKFDVWLRRRNGKRPLAPTDGKA
jgi:hypothetical protein